MELQLVREEQTTGEPNHWFLFLAREGQPGVIFQVQGDAIAIHHAHLPDTNILISESYKDSYVIARLDENQAERVGHWASEEAPPAATNQAAVRENCQGWTIRVMRRLVTEGIVEQKWVDIAVGLQEPVQ